MSASVKKHKVAHGTAKPTPTKKDDGNNDGDADKSATDKTGPENNKALKNSKGKGKNAKGKKDNATTQERTRAMTSSSAPSGATAKESAEELTSTHATKAADRRARIKAELEQEEAEDRKAASDNRSKSWGSGVPCDRTNWFEHAAQRMLSGAPPRRGASVNPHAQFAARVPIDRPPPPTPIAPIPRPTAVAAPPPPTTPTKRIIEISKNGKKTCPVIVSESLPEDKTILARALLVSKSPAAPRPKEQPQPQPPLSTPEPLEKAGFTESASSTMVETGVTTATIPPKQWVANFDTDRFEGYRRPRGKPKSEPEWSSDIRPSSDDPLDAVTVFWPDGFQYSPPSVLNDDLKRRSEGRTVWCNATSAATEKQTASRGKAARGNNSARGGKRGRGEGRGRGRGKQDKLQGGRAKGRGGAKEKYDPDGDGRHEHNSKSLGLPSQESDVGRVELKYAPETGTPSALIQLKVNGTQRCQVTVNKWGLQRSLQIANQLYKDFVDGKVELRDIYSWRNQLEGEMVLQDVKDNFAKNTANAAAGKDEEVGRPKAGFTTPFSALELVIRKHLVGLAKEDHKREKGTATFLKKTASPKERAIALQAKIEEATAAADAGAKEGSAAAAAGRSEVVENEHKDQDEVDEAPKEEEEEEEEQDEEEIENEDKEDDEEKDGGRRRGRRRAPVSTTPFT